MSHVNTVLGPIHPDELGITAPHEHVIWGPPGWEFDTEWWFNYPKVFELCLSRLVDFRDKGGKTIVDCSGIGMGRDIEFYRMLSAYSGVNIVACTGFWAGVGIITYFKDKDIEYFEDLFMSELTEGIGKSGAKAGAIKIANGRSGVSDLEERTFRAAARASKRTGCAIITHGVLFALKQLDILESEGLDLSRVIVSHCVESTAMDLERDQAVARRGAWVLYDQWPIVHTGVPNSYCNPVEIKADQAKAFIETGYLDQFLMSSDTNCFSTGWQRSSPYAGQTYVGDFLRDAPNNLRRVGISEEVFWQIMSENPKKALPMSD